MDRGYPVGPLALDTRRLKKPYPSGNWSVTTTKSLICRLFLTSFRIGRGGVPGAPKRGEPPLDMPAGPSQLAGRFTAVERPSTQRMVSVLSASSACRAMSESASFGTALAAMIKDPSSSLTNCAVTVS